MSILYDYLKLVEKKEEGRKAAGREAPVRQPEVSVPKKIGLNAWFYPAAAFLFLSGVLTVLLFFRNTSVPTKPPVPEKPVNSQQPLPAASQDMSVSNANNAGGPDFSLKGIIYNTDAPSAIINDRLIGKNARIGDWRVADISPTQVTLENLKNNSELTLKLNLPSGQAPSDRESSTGTVPVSRFNGIPLANTEPAGKAIE